MELLIFSDSHGRSERIEEALERQLRAPAAVLFAGDGLRDLQNIDFGRSALYEVAGNCDWFASDTPAERLLFWEGHKLLLTHGHLYGVKHGYGTLLSHAVKEDIDLVVFGHTHTPCCEVFSAGTTLFGKTLERPIYLFNPGSLGDSGRFGTLMLSGNTVLFSHGSL